MLKKNYWYYIAMLGTINNKLVLAGYRVGPTNCTKLVGFYSILILVDNLMPKSLHISMKYMICKWIFFATL